MKGILDDATIPIPCPGCGQKTEQSIGWIKARDKFTCACGAIINLDNDQFREELAKIDRATGELERALKSLGDLE